MVVASWDTILLEYVCPSLGCLMASIMFAAPVQDLRTALQLGSLKDLNPFPWAMMTGNCLGWVVYGYYKHDPFVLAANLPGLILSLWLNTGAAKLQYHQYCTAHQQNQQQHLHQQSALAAHRDAVVALSNEDEDGPSTVPLVEEIGDSIDPELLTFVPQEVLLLRVLCTWAVIVVWVGWFAPPNVNSAMAIGIMVNINLVFFYGAPLQTLRVVISTSTSISIHRPSMYMNWCNTSFWIMYGVAIQDIVIIIPNVIGLLLGLVQGIVCLIYPPGHEQQQQQQQQPISRADGSSPHVPYRDAPLAREDADAAIDISPTINGTTVRISPESELPLS